VSKLTSLSLCLSVSLYLSLSLLTSPSPCRAKDSVQLKAVEKSLSEATKNIVSQLEIDERSLADIQQSRKDLERQLQQMHSQREDADEEESEEDDRDKGNNQNQSSPLPPQSSKSVIPSPPPNYLARQSSLSRLQSRDEFQSSSSGGGAAAAVSLLKYDRSDVGRKMELYIYRYNCWEVIEIVDYETAKGLHKCRHLDKTEQWIDLKKKQIKEIS
jgi:hypothetical protein